VSCHTVWFRFPSWFQCPKACFLDAIFFYLGHSDFKIVPAA
jgi:hypothetical protein